MQLKPRTNFDAIVSKQKSSSGSSTSALASDSSFSAATSQALPSAVQSSSGGLTTANSVTTRAPKLPSEITEKTIEIIKDWNTELQERTAKFQWQATAFAEWDMRILQNRNILIWLEAEVAKVVETQTNLEKQLELIETHQQEVDKALERMEQEAECICKDECALLLKDEATSVRDSMYYQTEFIERETQGIAEQGGDLDMVDAASPLDIVVRILDNELRTLMWINEKANELSNHIQVVAKSGATAEHAYFPRLSPLFSQSSPCWLSQAQMYQPLYPRMKLLLLTRFWFSVNSSFEAITGFRAHTLKLEEILLIRLIN
ncbi:hypothetical protein OPV22_021645 [Ensete ventricosum]|uniref:Nucleoporin NSP1-like C-terminal domain-containing protein n=1 Tax=Ensete ventricosum TaxID=4639 RepID=A0AAV8QLP1_ENSVE|nr:hypothetical protein OPV22_021645 [Ensete ventricosum]